MIFDFGQNLSGAPSYPCLWQDEADDIQASLC